MPDVLDSSYQEAVLDAMVAEPHEIRPLVVLSKDSALSTIQGQYVLLGSIHHFPESYPEGIVIKLPVTAWTFTDKELIAWLKDPKHVLPANQEIWRLKQMLGLPPHEYYSHVSFYWVNLKDVIRPATSIDPRQEVMQPVLNQATPILYKEWFQEQVVDAYSSHLYPWTRLGYTYDWGKSEQDDAYGVTEFLVHKGAIVSIAVTMPLIDFIKSPQLASSKVQLAYHNAVEKVEKGGKVVKEGMVGMVGTSVQSSSAQNTKLEGIKKTVSAIAELPITSSFFSGNFEEDTSNAVWHKNKAASVLHTMESNLQLKSMTTEQDLQKIPAGVNDKEQGQGQCLEQCQDQVKEQCRNQCQYQVKEQCRNQCRYQVKEQCRDQGRKLGREQKIEQSKVNSAQDLASQAVLNENLHNVSDFAGKTESIILCCPENATSISSCGKPENAENTESAKHTENTDIKGNIVSTSSCGKPESKESIASTSSCAKPENVENAENTENIASVCSCGKPEGHTNIEELECVLTNFPPQYLPWIRS